jgi:muramoyltetrapeptide carboxypeptidase
LRGEEDLRRAEANARSLGCEPVVGEHALERVGYLAGDDAARLADLNAALADDTIDAIWCMRGGYGVMRLLARIDYPALRRRPKAVIGYSDITALHGAIATRCDVITYHGPTARSALTAFSRDSLRRALADDEPCGTAERAQTLHRGRARGHLIGGNLAVLCALCGTPYEPPYESAILIVEDVNEPVYRVDRLLTQLRLAGRLQQCAGIAFGAFTDIPVDSPEESLGARTLDEVLGETAAALGVPCLRGVPVGHIDDQWTLPLGAVVELDADARTLRILN